MRTIENFRNEIEGISSDSFYGSFHINSYYNFGIERELMNLSYNTEGGIDEKELFKLYNFYNNNDTEIFEILNEKHTEFFYVEMEELGYRLDDDCGYIDEKGDPVYIQDLVSFSIYSILYYFYFGTVRKDDYTVTNKKLNIENYNRWEKNKNRKEKLKKLKKVSLI